MDFQNAKAYWRGTVAALRLVPEHPRRQEASELLRQGLRMAYDGGTALPQLSPGVMDGKKKQAPWGPQKN